MAKAQKAAQQQASVHKITTTVTTKSGKSVSGTYSVNRDQDGFIHVKKDSGPTTTLSLTNIEFAHFSYICHRKSIT